MLKESRAGVIYSRLLKYTHQHTAGCYREPFGSISPKASPVCNIVPWCIYIIFKCTIISSTYLQWHVSYCRHFASVVYKYFTFEFPYLFVTTPGPLKLFLLERKWSDGIFSQSENIVWFRYIRRHQPKLRRMTLSRNKQKPNMLLICEFLKKNIFFKSLKLFMYDHSFFYGNLSTCGLILISKAKVTSMIVEH